MLAGWERRGIVWYRTGICIGAEMSEYGGTYNIGRRANEPVLVFFEVVKVLNPGAEIYTSTLEVSDSSSSPSSASPRHRRRALVSELARGEW